MKRRDRLDWELWAMQWVCVAAGVAALAVLVGVIRDAWRFGMLG